MYETAIVLLMVLHAECLDVLYGAAPQSHLPRRIDSHNGSGWIQPDDDDDMVYQYRAAQVDCDTWQCHVLGLTGS